jgi:hypothetical protein
MVAFGDKPGTPSAAQQADVAARAHEALPQSRASLTGTSEGGNHIQISVPADEAKRMPASDDRDFAAPSPPSHAQQLPLANLGWKALMVSGVAAADDDSIVEFAVDWPGITDEQRQTMKSRLRSDPGTPLPNKRPELGTVKVGEARAQLASNIEVMRSVYPADTIRRTRIVVVPIDHARSLFGLTADIRVSRLDDLKPKLGAVVGGLMTGLVGDDNAVIEGLAINVVDDEGQRAGWFHATRMGVGISIVPPDFGQEVPPVNVEFPNHTGGPRTGMPTFGSGNRRRARRTA